ncbi:hypothetical protein DMH26_36005 [Streptomyces sp. WAC 05379]|nr:hypothetical protein DMH26_36005 [Streptomyces sp. WAC 05379]
MLLLRGSRGLVELALGTLAQSQPRVVGILILLTVYVGIRARKVSLATGAAVAFALLMIQA